MNRTQQSEILVIGATGKTGRRPAQRLTALEVPVRPGSRGFQGANVVLGSGRTEAAKAPGGDAVGQAGTTVVNPPELH